jgi:two-component system, OmpR family, phosphate regulon sensor histidine kinase PhoR
VLDRAIGLAVQTYATEQALELQKRREEYLAFVAHDLRTPLNAVAVVASGLEETLRDRNAREDREWMLKSLRRNVQQLQRLVEKNHSGKHQSLHRKQDQTGTPGVRPLAAGGGVDL